MRRKVFFSFHYSRDSWRVAQIRNCNVIGNYDKSRFLDAADWESIKRQGDQAIKSWIDNQLSGTSVVVVLVGRETAGRKWVKYEIQKALELGKGLIGIDISKIKDKSGELDERGTNPLPKGYPLYLWNRDEGRENIDKWIEKAAQDAGF